jgi:hypothetical protein
MGYLPRVLFFNAFELGAESANQVISSDEALGSTGALRLPFLSLLLTLDSRKDVIIARWRGESYIAFSHIYYGAQEL